MNGHLHLSVNLNKPQELRDAIEVLRNFLPETKDIPEVSREVWNIPGKELVTHVDKNTGEITQEHKRDSHGRFLKGRKK